MTRRITFAPGEYYHLYNRGTEKRNIFSSNGDYERFLTLLYLCNATFPVNLEEQGRRLREARLIERGDTLLDLCVYVLMPNHFHLLAREKNDGGISRFMQKLGTGYTGYFNTRFERSGALFQGKFQATHADNDNYLSYLVSYMHINPVKLIEPTWKETGITDRERAEKYLEQYRWSSYPDYLGHNRLEEIVLNKTALPEYCESAGDFKRAVNEWLNYKPE